MDNLQMFNEYKFKGEELISKLTTFAVERYRSHIAEIAKRFELPIENELYECGDEALVYMTVDYFLHEHRINGKTILEMYEESGFVENEFEREFITSMKNSYVSLYRVVNVSNDKGYVFLMDLFNNVKNSRLTDEELGYRVDDKKLVFLRVYRFKDINITMNTMYIYDNKYEEFIIKSINDVLNIGREKDKTFNLCLSMNGISKFIQENELMNMI